MAEKADMANDNVSLPPTYAPSDAYTESPPPAYRRPGVAAIKIAKIVCVTILMMTFIIGFFVVTHKYVQSKECHHDHHNNNGFQSTNNAAMFMPLPDSQKFVDTNDIIEKIEEHAEPEVEKDLKNKEQEIVEPKQTIDIKEEEELEKEMIEELNKNVKLPIDLLLGNPALAGRDVKCKVQKKQQKISDGILTQAIIVTCDDEENSSEDETNEQDMRALPPGMRRLNEPPMSLLGNLMKILASRPRTNESQEERQPIIRPFGGPMPFPVQRPFPGPFSPGAIHMVPIKRIEVARPDQLREGTSNGPRPVIMTSRGPIPLMRSTNIPRIIGSTDLTGPPAPPRLLFNQRREMNQIPFPFTNGPLPIRVIRLPENEDNEDTNESNDSPMNQLPPFHPLMNLQGRRARIFQLKPRDEEENNGPVTIRRIVPSEQLPQIHLPPPQMRMEANGRALHAPVARPEMRFPFRPQSRPFNLPEVRVSTGIEVNPSQEESHQEQLKPQPEEPIIIREDLQETKKAEFGPPKTHSVIESAPQNINEELPAREEESQSQPEILAPLIFSPENLVHFEPSDATPKQENDEPIAQASNIHKIILN